MSVIWPWIWEHAQVRTSQWKTIIFVSSLTCIRPCLYTYRAFIFFIPFSLVHFSTCLLSSHHNYSPLPSFLSFTLKSCHVTHCINCVFSADDKVLCEAKNFKQLYTGLFNYKSKNMYVRYRKTNIDRLMFGEKWKAVRVTTSPVSINELLIASFKRFLRGLSPLSVGKQIWQRTQISCFHAM
jgi:hypothetical protein